MKHISLLILSQLIFSTSYLAATLTGKYFNQTPPSLTAKIFAPGILSTIYHEHSSPIYSPDGKELFYTLSHKENHILMYMKMQNGKWSVPKAAPFTGNYDNDNAQFSADGNRLYFKSKTPIADSNEKLKSGDYNNWYVDKMNGQWSTTPKPNLTGEHNQTLSGTKYVDILSNVEDPYSNDIYYQKLVNGKYSAPVKMHNNINSDGLEYIHYVAPDESYMMISAFNRPSMITGSMGIYISFRSPEGVWSNVINMGESINIGGTTSRFPQVSPDGKYLFFSSDRNNDEPNHKLSMVEKSLAVNEPWKPDGGRDGDIYWISSEIIEKLRPKK